MKLETQKIRDVIRKNKLVPTSQRQMSLFGLNCIAIGYTKFLKNVDGIDISYSALLALGDKDGFQSLLNEQAVSKKISSYLKKTKDRDLDILDFVWDVYLYSEKGYQKALTISDPKKCLREICDFYPKYMQSIGTYNSFWRFVGNGNSLISEKAVGRILKEREVVAKLYPKVENLFKDVVGKAANEYDIEQVVLENISHDEMLLFVNDNLSFVKNKSEFVSRSKGYIFLMTNQNNRVYINSDPNDYIKVKEEFVDVQEDIREIKGFSAYKGQVRGRAHLFNSKEKFPKSFIYVASMTKPDDIATLKKSKAIITDEGGILCHAAIVARELKKPCVIGTKVATKVLKDGDLVEVDADQGIVKIIK